MITEDYISFETAKLLKEKGFAIDCEWAYTEKGNLFNTLHYTEIQIYAYRPTLQMAMRWLREIHNIQVQPYALSLGWYFEILNLEKKDISGCAYMHRVGIPDKEKCLNSYEEAAEAAIKYCLENLV